MTVVCSDDEEGVVPVAVTGVQNLHLGQRVGGAEVEGHGLHVGAVQRDPVGALVGVSGALGGEPIEQVRGIATSDCSELRYHVYLTVVRDGARYRLLMNLNDRSRSKDKLLLGRNWLRHGFVVDVSKTK